MPLSLHEQLSKFAEAADGLRDDVSNAELEQLGKEIDKHAADIWAYHKLIEADAERLYAKAKELSEAAKTQKNKSDRVKEYLRYTLKVNGFTKFKAGDLQFSISESKKAVAKRPATETDFYSMPDLINPKFTWTYEPTVNDWVTNQEKVTPHFEWDLKTLKTMGREDLIDYETTTKLTVKIAKED